MAEQTHTKLTLVAVRDDEQGRYKFGVELDGAFIPLAAVKISYVDDAIAAAKEAKASKSNKGAG